MEVKKKEQGRREKGEINKERYKYTNNNPPPLHPKFGSSIVP